MRLLILLATFLFSASSYAKDLFGFVISDGYYETYNSFNDTYSRVICEDGDEKIHNSKLRLNAESMKDIQSSLESLEFWYMETEELVTYGKGYIATSSSTCSAKRIFAQKNSETNLVWAVCSPFPKKKMKKGAQFMDIFNQIQSYLKDNDEYKKIPKSICSKF